jgi:D-ribose pyranase
MKKGKMLNAHIMEVISKMGHTDAICIGDAGLPIPNGVERIDLALVMGVPSFLQVLDALLETFECESYVIADEITSMNHAMEEAIQQRLPDTNYTYVSHESFKEQCKDVKAIIRTGECTPYANIILKSGVIF